MKARILFSLLPVILIFSCSSEKEKFIVEVPEGTYTFEGIVRDYKTNEPMKDVKVMITVGDGNDLAFFNELGCVVVNGGFSLRCIPLRRDTTYTDSLGRYHFEVKKILNGNAYRFELEKNNYGYLYPAGIFYNVIPRNDNYRDDLYMSSTGKIKIKTISNTPAVKDSMNIQLAYPPRFSDFFFQVPYSYLTIKRYKEESGEETLNAVSYFASYLILSWEGTSNGVAVSGRDSFQIKPFETIEKIIEY